LLAVAATLAVAFAISRRYSRHVVMGSSMSPAVEEGDWIVVDRHAYADRAPRRGEVVLARDPRQPERELVKRVDHVDLHGAAWLLGDNAAASTDSRTFGAVDTDAVVGRVVGRYWRGSRQIDS
jgi:nickel-type superoxide dismutase maturation protease